MNKRIADISRDIQQECHESVENILANTQAFNYQDATNVFFFRKLAELTFEIEQLKTQPK